MKSEEDPRVIAAREAISERLLRPDPVCPEDLAIEALNAAKLVSDREDMESWKRRQGQRHEILNTVIILFCTAAILVALVLVVAEI